MPSRNDDARQPPAFPGNSICGMGTRPIAVRGPRDSPPQSKQNNGPSSLRRAVPSPCRGRTRSTPRSAEHFQRENALPMRKRGPPQRHKRTLFALCHAGASVSFSCDVVKSHNESVPKYRGAVPKTSDIPKRGHPGPDGNRICRAVDVGPATPQKRRRCAGGVMRADLGRFPPPSVPQTQSCPDNSG